MPCADQAGNAQDARIPGMLKEASTIKRFSHWMISSLAMDANWDAIFS